MFISKIEKVPRGIQGEKSSKDMASSRNLVSTIGAQLRTELYFHKNFTFSEFCESTFHFNALLKPSGHTVLKTIYEVVNHSVQI